MKHCCKWVGENYLYIDYHDREWRIPVFEDFILFEFLVLEIFQTCLSWITILRKRENFRKTFAYFDYKNIATYDENKYQELLEKKEIVRNKLKIKATISNAKIFIGIQNQFGSYTNYIWRFVDYKPVNNKWKSVKETPSKTNLSDKISIDLKNRGFTFNGSRIVYAYMQANGIVNNHVINCFRYKEKKKYTDE